MAEKYTTNCYITCLFEILPECLLKYDKQNISRHANLIFGNKCNPSDSVACTGQTIHFANTLVQEILEQENCTSKSFTYTRIQYSSCLGSKALVTMCRLYSRTENLLADAPSSDCILQKDIQLSLRAFYKACQKYSPEHLCVEMS